MDPKRKSKAEKHGEGVEGIRIGNDSGWTRVVVCVHRNFQRTWELKVSGSSTWVDGTIFKT